MEIRLLGPIELRLEGGGTVEISGSKRRAVLALLALEPGRSVPVERFFELMWGSHPPAQARAALQGHVAALRKVLKGSSFTVLTRASGYMLTGDFDRIDVRLSEALLARARATADETSAVALLRRALDLWQGEALGGLPDTDLRRFLTERLNDQRIQLIEAWAERLLRLDQGLAAVPLLDQCVRAEGLREPTIALLIRCLHQSGRISEAVSVYHQARARLSDELGVGPSADLYEAFYAVLEGDAAAKPRPKAQAETTLGPLLRRLRQAQGTSLDMLADSVSQDAGYLHDIENGTAVPSLDLVRRFDRLLGANGALVAHSLESAQEDAPDPGIAQPPIRPAQLPDAPQMIGRTETVARILGELQSDPRSAIVAFDGMGGVGKTTLALHIAYSLADRYPDGSLYTDLRGQDLSAGPVDPSEVLESFLRALGTDPRAIPTSLTDRAALWRSTAADRRLLIVLDNAADTQRTVPLLPGSAHCLTIITSRTRLAGLSIRHAAQLTTLTPLERDDANAVLRSALGSARTDAEPEALAELARHCGRLPLALRIVAERAATYGDRPLRAIAHQLADEQARLDTLSVPGDPSIGVRPAFSWSYQGLPPDLARAYRLLSLHPTPQFSLAAVSALLSLPTTRASVLLDELTATHLLTHSGPDRYTMHDLLRLYAAERAGVEESTDARHEAVVRSLNWYLWSTWAAARVLTPHRLNLDPKTDPAVAAPRSFADNEEALAWWGDERENLIATVEQAVAYGEDAIAAQLVAGMWGFMYVGRHLTDWVRVGLIGLDAARRVDDKLLAQMLVDLAGAYALGGRYTEAARPLEEALALYATLDDSNGLARATLNLGDLLQREGHHSKALHYAEEAVSLTREAKNPWLLGIGLTNMGECLVDLGRPQEAVNCLHDALGIHQEHGNRWVEAVTLTLVANAYNRLGNWEQATLSYDAALQAHHDAGNQWGQGWTLHHLATALLERGHTDHARQTWNSALVILDRAADPLGQTVRERLSELRLDRLERCPH
ncbi:AfsR/SARP family transcriptional regulator [Streptomyces sp. NPDC005122]